MMYEIIIDEMDFDTYHIYVKDQGSRKLNYHIASIHSDFLDADIKEKIRSDGWADIYFEMVE